jgi:hypothetical protein
VEFNLDADPAHAGTEMFMEKFIGLIDEEISRIVDTVLTTSEPFHTNSREAATSIKLVLQLLKPLQPRRRPMPT